MRQKFQMDEASPQLGFKIGNSVTGADWLLTESPIGGKGEDGRH